MKPKHEHEFVETYDGLVGFGLDRATDENTVICYLQKFSDDRLMETLRKRFSDGDLQGIFEMISSLLRTHLSEAEYHRLFLRDENDDHR
jgi:hypothetical protein